MQIVFSQALAAEAATPQPGRLYLVPRETVGGRCVTLACVVVERGAAAFISAGGPIEFLVAQNDPTLDDMLATILLEQSLRGEPVPAGAEAFSRYAAICREGLRPSNLPLEDSLEGMFLAVRSGFPDDLSPVEEGRRFLEAWAPLAQRILEACRTGTDPFVTPLFRDRPQFARQHAYLARDHEVYRQDVARGERWRVKLPEGPPEASALVLRHPKSVLWKYWARSDDQAPTGGVYLLLILEREPGHWVFSTDPVQRLPLKTLAAELQKAESARDAARAAADPWFDGKSFGHTLVAAPRAGSQLGDARILEIVRRWAQAKPVRPRTRRAGLWAAAAAAAVVALVTAVGIWTARGPRPAAIRRLSQVPVTEPPARAVMNLKQGSDLHVLAIGVSRYADSNYDLEVADKDAQAFAAAFRDRPAELFRKVYVRELVNNDATRDGILRALGELERAVTQNDLAIISFAGHGISDVHQDFFFLPHDYDSSKEIATTAISWDEARRSLGHMACLVVLVMDSCQSGTITRTGLRGIPELEMKTATDKALSRFAQSDKGAVVMAASLANQSAQERNTWGHGALTLSLVEGIRGERVVMETKETPLPQEIDRDGLISLQELSFYTSTRVKELTGGGQAVITNHTGNLSLDDVPIALGRKAP